MIEEYEYPELCPECGRKMPGLGFFPPRATKPAKVLFVASAPLMAVWAVGFFLFSPVLVLAAGGWPEIIFTAFVYLGPGFGLALWGMYLSRVRRAKCDQCDYVVEVRGPNMFGMR
jgi:hypothetical protein